MKFGVILPNFGETTTYGAIRETAVAAERLGFASVWTTDHVLVPRENTDPYGTMYEALVTLALIAEAVTRLQLGTSILVLPMRSPVLVAKQVATIDAATNGRMILGVAVGWNEQEYGFLNADFRTRGKHLDEYIQLLRAIWTSEEINFHGKYVRVEHGVSFPLRKQGIPIWIGGNEEPALRRAAKLGDGWHATGPSPEEMAQGVKRLHELNPEKKLTISVRLSIDSGPNASPTYKYRGNTRYRLTGTPEAIQARLREYAQAGTDQVMLMFPMKDHTEDLKQMEQFARDVMPGLVTSGK